MPTKKQPIKTMYATEYVMNSQDFFNSYTQDFMSTVKVPIWNGVAYQLCNVIKLSTEIELEANGQLVQVNLNLSNFVNSPPTDYISFALVYDIKLDDGTIIQNMSMVPNSTNKTTGTNQNTIIYPESDEGWGYNPTYWGMKNGGAFSNMRMYFWYQDSTDIFNAPEVVATDLSPVCDVFAIEVIQKI